MALTWTQQYKKAQRISNDNTAATLEQLKQDLNTGYHMFNSRFARYYARKQQFTNLVASQQLYQVPIDCNRIMGITVMVTNNYQPTVKEVRSEYQWRQITSWQTTSNWPAWYFMIGNDTLSLWPLPSTSVTNGLRFYYQQADHDLSVEDVTSEDNSSGSTVTVTVTNGSTEVTASSGIFTEAMVGLSLQVTNITPNFWYEIIAVPDAQTLTLKTAYVGPSGSGQTWVIGQLGILPPEFADYPMHHALFNFFTSKGNTDRASYHKALLDAAIELARETYSSSNTSSVITSDDVPLNPWLFPPVPAV